MCMYCERRQDEKFGWEQPKLPYHDQKDSSANITGNMTNIKTTEGFIHDDQTSCPNLIITDTSFFGDDGIGALCIPIKYCPECGRKLGKQ